MFAAISNLFSSAKEEPVKATPTEPFSVDPPKPKTKRSGGGKHVGIFVGHSRHGDKGAVSVGGVSEWVFNSKLADRLAGILRDYGYRVTVVKDYQNRSYTRAMNYVAKLTRDKNMSLALELHFNAVKDRSVKGHEWLYWFGSAVSKRAAEIMEESFHRMFPNAPRRGAKRRKSPQNGAQFLRKTACQAMICEPFFGTNEQEWSFYSKNVDRMALAYADGVFKILDDHG